VTGDTDLASIARVSLLSLGLVTQTFFVFLEYTQLKTMGFNSYIGQDPWNLVDVVQFILFVSLYAFSVGNGALESKTSIWVPTLHLTVLFMAFFKILYFLRNIAHTAPLVYMLMTTIRDIRSFIVFFMISLLVFALSAKIMNFYFDKGDYVDLSSFAMIFL
jgi:hypothetical protein